MFKRFNSSHRMSDEPGSSTANRINNDTNENIATGYAVIPLKNCPHLIQVFWTKIFQTLYLDSTGP